jgi:hypothetical protein
LARTEKIKTWSLSFKKFKKNEYIEFIEDAKIAKNKRHMWVLFFGTKNCHKYPKIKTK